MGASSDNVSPTDGISVPTLLLVDDEPNTLSALRRLFHPHGYRILTAESAREGLVQLAREPVDLVISDMRMPEMNGAQFLEKVGVRWPDTIRILLTGYAEIGVTIDAINKGKIYRYISKPWDANDVCLTVAQALDVKCLEREKRRLEVLTQQQNTELKLLNANLLRQQDALRLAANRMQAILQHAADAVITVDSRGSIESFNYAGEQLFGYCAAQVMGCSIERLLVGQFQKEYCVPAQHIAVGADEKLGATARSEVVARRSDGVEFTAEVSVSCVVESDRHFFTVFLRDVTQRKLAESAITYLAHHDMLTGLPNRRLLADRIEQAIIRAKRSGAEFAVMFLDLDNFKPINDTYGHDVGDQLLQLVARRVTVSLRAEDTVGRQGGDEFIVLLESLSLPSALPMVVEKIQGALAAPYLIEGYALSVSASIGIAVYPADGANVETLFKNSDRAMYHAKKLGRNNAQLFGAGMQGLQADGK